VTFDATVLVLAKSPRPGRVKTRLCPPCTPEQAAGIAAAALADTLDTVATVPVRRRVLVLDGPTGPWLPAGFDVVPQVGGGLGVRLAAAFAAAKGPAFLVGMDTPQLTAAGLGRALDRLADPAVDATLGRATDGGWWGLGLTRSVPSAFDRVPMSSPRTGASQVRRLRQLGLRTRLLPDLRDVDHFGDALAVATATPGSRFAATVGAVEALVTARAS
jgi:hypothetical protein